MSDMADSGRSLFPARQIARIIAEVRWDDNSRVSITMDH